ncbi:hypothetical protein [Silvimonas iriomotensis]|uniref:Uncharacterized protein n=1 Tax=Silvimonas iriomotensis TaxID=449662 RepID=A0ABQ2P4M8_9NEIS|nr:hypothetical protein [Silvimonas iriomotensis]GGP17768.1 hypothetical protein GCM10010970_01450 [Silvimonas iriomotensis]
MHTLTFEQIAMLLDIITSIQGYELGYLDFSNQALFFFEDIPGFETIPLSVANDIVGKLWSNYCEQNKNPSVH